MRSRHWNRKAGFTFNEQVFLPATVQFNCTKQHLYQFEQDYPHLDPLIKTLLRTYEGIFDFSCFISESLLARLLRIEEQKVAQLLTELHHRHILIYTPRKDKPQLYVLRNRIPIREFSINKKNYEERKERLRLRVQQMIGYVEGPQHLPQPDHRGLFWRQYHEALWYMR
jgi:ATP-dependent DNA helicase RecQ